MSLPEQIDALLPQSQCRLCGYADCRAYAAALAEGRAAVNLCTPGGSEVMRDIAALLMLPEKPVAPAERRIAWIREEGCIGCTACIRACPVDAVMGASKQMHTVIADECTGCTLCLPACPTDCIEMLPESAQYLPRAPILSAESTPRAAAADHARRRYDARRSRPARRNRRSAVIAADTIAALLAQAQQKAAAKSAGGRVAVVGENLKRQKIAKQQQLSALRRERMNRKAQSAHGEKPAHSGDD